MAHLPASDLDEPQLAQGAHLVRVPWSVPSIMLAHMHVCVKCYSHPLHYLSEILGKSTMCGFVSISRITK